MLFVANGGKMNENFEKAVKFILQKEGGYVNHPDDPGGETKYGISKRAYPALDIKNLTEDIAKELYFSDYWIKAGCDKLEWPLNLIIFDTAVNCGIGRALEFFKLSNGWVDYLFLRIAYYSSLNKPMFLKGWINRVVDIYKMSR